MQQKIDRRQDALDQNEDRIANIILNSPKSQHSADQAEKSPKEPEDALAAKEKQLREKDVLQEDVRSDADTKQGAQDAAAEEEKQEKFELEPDADNLSGKQSPRSYRSSSKNKSSTSPAGLQQKSSHKTSSVSAQHLPASSVNVNGGDLSPRSNRSSSDKNSSQMQQRKSPLAQPVQSGEPLLKVNEAPAQIE